MPLEQESNPSTLDFDHPQLRSRALAARIATLRESIETAIEGADDLHKPVPRTVRIMPANLTAWMNMVQRP